MGRVTNALGWVAATPPSWLPAVATPDQIERYVRPAIAGDREECYAITEEGAGSDVDAIEATAYRDQDQYVLNGIKWHVTSFNSAGYAFFQARLTRRPARRRARHVPGGPAQPGRAGGQDAGLHPHD